MAKKPAKKSVPRRKSLAAKPKPAAKKPAAKAPATEPAIRPAPAVGKPAPDFSLAADDGSTLTLASLRGKPVVLYFYPKDDTPGCTIEACAFRDASKDLSEKGAIVLGVSRDTVQKHQKFKEKHALNFTLLSDPNGKVISAYGSWGPKIFMGRKFNGTLRTTFLIDGEGNIARAYPRVSPKTHADEVLKDLAALSR